MSFGYRKKNLFNQLQLSMTNGKICGLLGKNGAGKTTLLNIICGLQLTKDGTITINHLSVKNRNQPYLAQFFLVPEEFSFPTIKTNAFLKTYAPFYPNFDFNAFQQYMDEFKIPNNKHLTKMSMGEKKKFLLSFGLATKTKVLIMDEPTNGLDIPSKSTFRKIMASAISEDRLFIISTHQVKDIEGIIDQIIVLDNGKITFDASIHEITDNFTFKRIGNNEMVADIIYAEKVLGGRNIICKNNSDDFSEVDIELLFNAVITDSSLIDTIKPTSNKKIAQS